MALAIAVDFEPRRSPFLFPSSPTPDSSPNTRVSFKLEQGQS